MSKLLSIALASCILVLSLSMANVAPDQVSAMSSAASSCTGANCVYMPSVSYYANGVGKKACMVTDLGGIHDQGFNALAWQGFEDAQRNMGVTVAYLESATTSDYQKNINAFVAQRCDLITTVGFLMGDITKAEAQGHPGQKFAIVDYAYDPAISNVRSLTFEVNQPAFLAGYLAAGMTSTGIVGTFGGMQIPTVVDFMDGFSAGVEYYNQMNGTSVTLYGWNHTSQTGLFINDFVDTQKGIAAANSLMDEGADIILPVAGAAGLGAADAVTTAGNAWVIGVDTDWTITASNYQPVLLTSVMKRIDRLTYNTVADVVLNRFKGGSYHGTLANGGVGLGTIADDVPADLLAELNQVKAGIINGSIPTKYP